MLYIRRCACVLASFVFAPAALAQHNPQRQYLIIVQPNSLPLQRQAALVTALATLSEPNEWPEERVPDGECVHRIVATRYRYTDRHPAVRDALADLIVRANNLESPSSCPAGLSVRVPKIPPRPYDEGADSSEVQLVSAESDEIRRLDADSVASVTAEGQVSRLHRAANWMFEATPHTLRRFERALPDSLPPEAFGDALYIGAPSAYGVLSAPTVELDATAKEWPALPTAKVAAGLVPADAGRLFLFDFFERLDSTGRAHGVMVEDVARAALAAYGAPQLSVNIERVELDFWDNRGKVRQQAIDEVEAYLPYLNEGVAGTYRGYLEQWKRRPRPANNAVPGIYVEALYGNRILRNKPAVLASAFYGYLEGRILPPFQLAEFPIVLVSAVLNGPGSTIEGIGQVEPQRTFAALSEHFGIVLVGATDANLQSIGMFSGVGSGVTVAGRGTGWQGRAIRPNDRGTSFATPSIAAAILVAQAARLQKGDTISAHDIVRRLALASEVVPNLVGRYASAGIPRIDRLLLPSGVYGVRRDGTTVRLERVSGELWVSFPGGGTARLDIPVPGYDDPDVLGLAVLDGKLFAYQPRKRMWRLLEVTDLNIQVHEGGVAHPPIRSLVEFTSRYSEIIIL
jgi:hypothetical protein